MPQTPYVFDATRDNFAGLVLGNSERGLVLVHYWTSKAAPCALLTPRLVKLAEAYGGRFLLVLANTDELRRIAHEQGVTSVPTVKFYLHGEAVHTIHGAEPDSSFRAALARFIAAPEDRLRQDALRAHADGDTTRAIALLARAAVERPDDLDNALDLAKLLTLDGQAEQALRLLSALPREARRDGRIAPLLAHLELLDAVQAPAAPQAVADDPVWQLHAAALELVADRREEAMERLLALSRTHSDFRDDIGRRGLLALFAMLGAEHELTRRFRARLAQGS
ncbi:MAG TPA: tetratricopeptide repeat protein [Thiobacillaceae bacterium]|nr:tetratricopeptide repeat protein [Thiobacillaceae bacterium]